LFLSHPDLEQALAVSLHNWRVEGLPYTGLPEDVDEAAERRAERFVVKTISRADIPPAVIPPLDAVTGFTLDLRGL
jgi:hypothetical protein